MVQALPSSQGAVLGTCVHVPVALQTSSVQAFASVGHAVPAGSSRQRAEQHPPSALMPTSQFSRGSITPFPHFVSRNGPGPLVPLIQCAMASPVSSSPSPVPLKAKSAQSVSISPVTDTAPVSGSTVPLAENWYGAALRLTCPLIFRSVPACIT